MVGQLDHGRARLLGILRLVQVGHDKPKRLDRPDGLGALATPGSAPRSRVASVMAFFSRSSRSALERLSGRAATRITARRADEPMAGVAVGLRQVQQLGRRPRRRASCTSARMPASRRRGFVVGNGRFDDLQRRRPADAAQRGQQGRLVVFARTWPRRPRAGPARSAAFSIRLQTNMTAFSAASRSGPGSALSTPLSMPATCSGPANFPSAAMAAVRTAASASSAAARMSGTLSTRAAGQQHPDQFRAGLGLRLLPLGDDRLD